MISWHVDEPRDSEIAATERPVETRFLSCRSMGMRVHQVLPLSTVSRSRQENGFLDQAQKEDRMIKRLAVLFVLVALVGCAAQEPPTYTPQPTYTPAPTYTPERAATSTPEPTNTPEPTQPGAGGDNRPR